MNKQNLFGFNFSVDRHEDGSIRASAQAELTEAGKQTVLGFIAGALGALSDRFPDVITYEENEDKMCDNKPQDNATQQGSTSDFMDDVSKFMNKK